MGSADTNVAESAISFDRTERDIARLYEQAVRTSSTSLRLRAFTIAAVGVATAWATHTSGRPADVAVVVGLAASSVVIVSYFWGGPRFNQWVWMRQVREGRRGLLGPQAVSLRSEGLYSTSRGGDGTLRWCAIDRIDEDSEYIYFMLAGAGVVVPKRAFATAEAANEFMERAQEYHRAADAAR